MNITIIEATKPLEDLIKSLYSRDVVFESIIQIESLSNNSVYRVIGKHQLKFNELVFVSRFTTNFYQIIR